METLPTAVCFWVMHFQGEESKSKTQSRTWQFIYEELRELFLYFRLQIRYVLKACVRNPLSVSAE